MMKQQYMAMKFPGASWNQEAATLPKAPAIPTEHPRELHHQLIGSRTRFEDVILLHPQQEVALNVLKPWTPVVDFAITLGP